MNEPASTTELRTRRAASVGLYIVRFRPVIAKERAISLPRIRSSRYLVVMNNYSA